MTAYRDKLNAGHYAPGKATTKPTTGQRVAQASAGFKPVTQPELKTTKRRRSRKA